VWNIHYLGRCSKTVLISTTFPNFESICEVDFIFQVDTVILGRVPQSVGIATGYGLDGSAIESR
jgi:hypothetical protein